LLLLLAYVRNWNIFLTILNRRYRELKFVPILRFKFSTCRCTFDILRVRFSSFEFNFPICLVNFNYWFFLGKNRDMKFRHIRQVFHSGQYQQIDWANSCQRVLYIITTDLHTLRPTPLGPLGHSHCRIFSLCYSIGKWYFVSGVYRVILK